MKLKHLHIFTILFMAFIYDANAQDMRWNKLREIIEEHVGTKTNGTASLDVTIIFPDKGPVNLSITKDGISSDTSSLFYRVASCSKPITAAMAMMLVENGAFELEDIVHDYFEFDSEYTDQITFEMLLNHSSGLNDHQYNSNAVSLAVREPSKIWDIDEKIEYANAVQVNEPLKEYFYTNTGIDLVGNAIGAVTGVPTEQMIADSIFAPLGLESFIDVWSNPNHKIDRLAENSRSYEYHQTYFKYSGANTSTSFDQAIVMKAIYGGYLFDQKYADRMMTSSNLNSVYGLGSRLWFDNIGGETLLSAGHTGTSKNYKSFSCYIPDLDVTLCVTTNTTFSNWNAILNDVFFFAVEEAPDQQQIADMVVTPKLKSVIASGDAVLVHWEKYNQVILDGFRLYGSEDNNTWTLLADETVLDFKTRNFTLKNIGDKLQNIKLTAVKNGIEGADSDIYAVKTHANKLLIVDGFDRYGLSDGWEYPTHSFVTRYAKAIANYSDINYSISSCSNEDVEQGGVNLNDYEMILWVLGDENTICSTFSITEQDKIKNYLENGGKLFVSG